MAERSKAYKLPPGLRQEIEKAWSDGHVSLDEIMEFIRSKVPDADVSRASVGRHLQKFSETAKRIRQAREVASGIMKEIGASDDTETGRLLAEMLSGLAMNTLDELGGKESTDTKELFFLSATLKNLASAKKTEIDREQKTREMVRKEALAKLDAKEKDTKKDGAGGFDEAAFEKARELVRGIL